mgnify:CR=1 FL=1
MEKISQNNLCSLIPCAGQGKRSGLLYPKTLYKINNKPILIYVLELVCNFTNDIFIVINPKDEKIFNKTLKNYKYNVKFVYQKQPKGMGDAILASKQSLSKFENILLIWGDIPFIKIKTVKATLDFYYNKKYDFVFPTRLVNCPYTVVKRNKYFKISEIIETKNNNISIKMGEREIGLFIFKKNAVFELLLKNLSNKFGSNDKEHGFLYIVEHLVKRNYKVEGINIASRLETKSLNFLSDLKL